MRISMKRTNISLTEEQYGWLRELAFAKTKSMSEIVRGFLSNPKTREAFANSQGLKGSDFISPKKISGTPKVADEFANKLSPDAQKEVDRITKEYSPAPKPKKGKK